MHFGRCMRLKRWRLTQSPGRSWAGTAIALVVSTTVMRNRASLRTEALPMTSGSLIPTCTLHQNHACSFELVQGLALDQQDGALGHTQMLCLMQFMRAALTIRSSPIITFRLFRSSAALPHFWSLPDSFRLTIADRTSAV